MSKGPPKILSVDEIPAEHFRVETNLPQAMVEGIGAVVVAQAFLEWRVTCIVFDLLIIDHPEGRVVLKDQSATERFKLVKSLLALRGIVVNAALRDLATEIDECTTCRNQLAHGVWCHVDGKIHLRLTKDSYDTEEGRITRAFVPQMKLLPSDYFEKSVAAIKGVSQRVMALGDEVTAALLPSLQKRGLRESEGSNPPRKA